VGTGVGQYKMGQVVLAEAERVELSHHATNTVTGFQDQADISFG